MTDRASVTDLSQRRRAADHSRRARMLSWLGDWRQRRRDFWMLVITFVVWQALMASDDALHRVQEGRSVGQGITCAVLSAVSEAGRATITGAEQGTPGELSKFLEQHGFPPKRVRLREARLAGRRYVEAIARRVEAAVGRRGDRLIRSNGTIDCRRLERIAKIPPSRQLARSP